MAAAIFLIGFTSLVSQVVLVRELLVAFWGNELSIGILLAAWMVWVGIGSGVMPRLLRSHRPQITLALLQAASALTLPLVLWLAYDIRSLGGAVPGEMIGFLPILLGTGLTLAPVCLLLGWQFTTACHIMSGRWSSGKVYFWESIGAVCGGLLAYFILLPQLNAWQILPGLGLLNLVSAAWLLLLQQPCLHFRFRLCVALATSLVVGVVFAFILLPAAGWLQNAALARRWQGFNLVEDRNSIYGNLAVTTTSGQFSLFENGLLLATSEDSLAAEEMAHLVLLQHPNPRRVLLVGGGINGILREVLKHPVAEVDYVELDPLVITTARTYLPELDRQALDDARTHIHFLDGRMFISIQAGRGQKYDLVLMNMPHPFTAQVNRFYTQEFFRLVEAVLEPQGIFAFSFISAENRPGKQLLALDGSLYRTLVSVFPSVLVLPGEEALLLAAPQYHVLTSSPTRLLARWQERQLRTSLYTPSHLELRLTAERLGYALTVFDRPAALNRDLQPASLYFDLVLWSSYFSNSLSNFMTTLYAGRSGWGILLALLILAGGLALWLAGKNRPGRRVRLALWLNIAVLGMAGTVWEVSLLFAYQVFYGYIYQHIALLISVFMGGLVVGSGLGTWLSRKVQAGTRLLVFIQAGAAGYSLFLLALLPTLQSACASGSQAGAGMLWLFLGIGGLLVGLAFPLAAATLQNQPGSSGGLYSADLAGAAGGALLAAAFLIPAAGLAQTLVFLAVLSAAGGLGVWVGFDKFEIN